MYDVSMTNCNCKEFKNTMLNEIITCGGASVSITKTKSVKSGSEMLSCL